MPCSPEETAGWRTSVIVLSECSYSAREHICPRPLCSIAPAEATSCSVLLIMGRYLEVRLNGPLSCCREGRSRSVSVKTHTATAQTNLQLADIISFHFYGTSAVVLSLPCASTMEPRASPPAIPPTRVAASAGNTSTGVIQAGRNASALGSDAVTLRLGSSLSQPA